MCDLFTGGGGSANADDCSQRGISQMLTIANKGGFRTRTMCVLRDNSSKFSEGFIKPVIEHCTETGIDLRAPLGPLILLEVKEVAESLNVPTVSLPPHIFAQLAPVVQAQDKQDAVLEAF